jgi:hypothetical protein
MAKFTKANLINVHGWVYYQPEGTNRSERRFVARFTKGPRGNVGPFMTFLRRNFEVDEWFQLTGEGQCGAGLSPIAAAETKGFILQHIKRWLKQDGFDVSFEGYRQWKSERASRWGV